VFRNVDNDSFVIASLWLKSISGCLWTLF